MLLNADYIEPVELTGYVREAAANLPVNQFSLARWLPNRPIDDLEYRFTRGGEGLIEAATFRAYDAESPIGHRPGLTRVSGELPPISRKIRLGEYDRLRQRSANATAVRDAILTDAERMARSVAARLELARGDALVNGSVTINENGVVATVSFGRSGSHSVTPGTPWSTIASATPLADLLSWQQTYITSNGEAPGAMVMPSTVLGYLLRNAEIRALVGSTLGVPSRVSQAALRGILDDHGLPPWYIVDEQINVNGSAVRPIPIDRFLYLPAPVDPNDADGTQLGATLLGTTAESLDPRYSLEEAERPGIVAGAYTTEDPIAVWTKAAAIGLPVSVNPDLSFVADVA
ncbi:MULTISPECIES: major capsid protein [unclassified Micromonospora]|uniref:major capsid protein n=1 Tax=unclassified Micromonospora TaxID=2617518 RepID=UPI0010338BA6|nr:major capsid protein [Verrucosispora sp. SN26_14.1]TBL44249.1 phage capsid protein [Verrucosispora sp. SN26_14.1]